MPQGLVLDHFFCDNRLCCNPAHVRPVTERENILRGKSPAAEHASRTHCPNGHPLAGDNLEAWALKQGDRRCKTCRRVIDREKQRMRRAGLRESR